MTYIPPTIKCNHCNRIRTELNDSFWYSVLLNIGKIVIRQFSTEEAMLGTPSICRDCLGTFVQKHNSVVYATAIPERNPKDGASKKLPIPFITPRD